MSTALVITSKALFGAQSPERVDNETNRERLFKHLGLIGRTLWRCPQGLVPLTLLPSAYVIGRHTPASLRPGERLEKEAFNIRNAQETLKRSNQIHPWWVVDYNHDVNNDAKVIEHCRLVEKTQRLPLVMNVSTGGAEIFKKRNTGLLAAANVSSVLFVDHDKGKGVPSSCSMHSVRELSSTLGGIPVGLFAVGRHTRVENDHLPELLQELRTPAEEWPVNYVARSAVGVRTRTENLSEVYS